MDVTALMMNALVLLLPACVQNGVSDKTAATFHRIVPSKLQLFEHTELNVTCEGFFHRLTKWRVMRSMKTVKRTSCNNSFLKFGACHILVSYSSDSGEYWCETEDEERSENVTITVTAGQVILESPVRPVTVGDTVVLRCTGKNNSHHRADFYKDGRHVNTSLTGEMTIHSVSVSDSGRYSCNISKDEKSAESVLRVRRDSVVTQFVQTGNDVTLDIMDPAALEDYIVFQWKYNNTKVLVTVPLKGEAVVHSERVVFNPQNYSVTLKNLQKADSGLYEAQLIKTTEQPILSKFLLTVKDSEEVSAGVSVCLVKSAVFSVGLVVMVSAVVSVHVLDCIKKKKL